MRKRDGSYPVARTWPASSVYLMTMLKLFSILLLGIVASPIWLAGQIVPSALRVLGQQNLRENSPNSTDAASMSNPGSQAVDDRNGELHLYVSDTANHRILAWRNVRDFENGTPANLVLGQLSERHTRGRGIGNRGLFGPSALVVNPANGDLYVSDTGDHRILRFPSPFDNTDRIEPDRVYGQVGFDTFGANPGGVGPRGFSTPAGIRFDTDGNLWIADSGNHRVLRYPAAALDADEPAADLVLGQVDFETRAANGGEPRSASGFATPVALAFHSNGSLYVADASNARVLTFTPPFVTGQAAARVLGQPDFESRLIPPVATASAMRGPNGIAIDSAGTLYVAIAAEHRVLVFDAVAMADPTQDANRVIGQLGFDRSSPNRNTFPLASEAGLQGPGDVTVDADRNLFVADSRNHRVVRYSPGSSEANAALGQSNLILNGVNGVDGSGLNAPFDVVVDYSESPFPVYVADALNHRVLGWRSSLRFLDGAQADLVIGQGDFTTGAPNPDTGRPQAPRAFSLSGPRGIALNDRGDLYVADSGNNRVLRFRRPVEQSGRIAAEAVLGQSDFFSALSAAVSDRTLNTPTDVSVGPDGAVYVADTANSRVLEFPPDPPTGASAVRVFGQADFETGAPAAEATAQSLNAPGGVHADAFRFLYIADAASHRVLVFPLTADLPVSAPTASAVIGQLSFENFRAGGGSAGLNGPSRVSSDLEGRIIVADTGNNRVVRYPSALFLPLSGAEAEFVYGQVDLNGQAVNIGSRDGLATPHGLASPFGVFSDRQGGVWVADAGNHRVVQYLRSAALVSAATFIPGTGVAPGSLVSLFAVGITESTEQASSVPLPQTLANRIVEVNGEFPVPLLFASENQMNLQFPVESPSGQQRIAIRTADTDELVAGAPIVVTPTQPGLFTRSQNGQGPALALNQDGSLNATDNPTLTGNVLQLFGTGQGPTNPVVASGEPAPAGPLAVTVAVPQTEAVECASIQSSLCVAVGSKLAEVLFSGLAPGFVGLWQLNIRIPSGEDVLTGEVPLTVFINQRVTNRVIVSIQ